MSRIITFSRTFPAHHPKKGQPTFFVEKFRTAMSILNMNTHVGDVLAALPAGAKPAVVNFNAPKYHTIRKLKKPFKVGDKFSPRYWGNDVNPKSGRSGPYHSKQITICDDVEVVEVYNIEFRPFQGETKIYIDGFFFSVMDDVATSEFSRLFKLAANDGLTVSELIGWFNKPFTGQIICWKPVKYNF